MDDRELALDSDGIALRGTVVPVDGGAEWPLVVLCHGIPGGVPVEGDPGYEALARLFTANGVGACYFNFRGTGISGGDFSLPGWVRDLDAVLDAVDAGGGPFAGCDPSRKALMGFSGGGAVGMVCAARRGGLRGVATLSSPADFTRLMPREAIGDFIDHARRIGIIRDPGFPPDADAYYREMLAVSPLAVAGSLAPTPLLVVHGGGDDLVPVEEARRLYEAASEPKELYVVAGGGHKLRLNAAAVDKAVSWIAEQLR